MTIKQQGGIFGRNPTFNNVEADGTLTVSGQTTFNSNITIQNDTTPKISILDSNSGFDAATFTSENGGRDLAIFAPQDIIFEQSGMETARFLDGGGLTFNGDTAAANALDDYEQGTWTPTYTTDGTDFGSVTYDTQDGHYTKIGNVVVLRAYLRTDAITVGSASGNVVVGGLPFSASNSRNAGSVIPSAFIGDHPIMIQASGSTAYLYYQASASGATSLLQVADLNTGANDNTIVFTVTYQAS